MNPKFFTASNYNSGMCLAFPFSYDHNITRFMLAYGLFKTSYDKNNKVIYWFSDVYDEMLDENFTNGTILKNSEENLYQIPFGYDGIKMQANITDRICVIRDEEYHFTNNDELNIPFYKIGDKYRFSTTEMFNLNKLKENIEFDLYQNLNKKDTGRMDIDEIRSKYDEIRSQLKEFEDGLKFKVFDIDIEYGYIKSYNQLISLIPRWAEE